jgi:3-deoxy-D-manno-octulosonic acid kinase
MLADMTVELTTTTGGAILYDSDRFGKLRAAPPTDELFEGDYWMRHGKVVARSGAGRGGVFFLRDGACHWALRHYRRGGLVGKLIHDRYVWMGAERTRAFAEWRLLQRLRELGLPVPAPVAARYIRSGVSYRGDLITEALPAVRTLAESIVGVQLLEETWRTIGATIAKFHRAGVHHADLNAHNILLGEGASIWLLDFDRGRIRERGAWEESVLKRLHRSLSKIRAQRPNVHFVDRDWRALLAGLSE